METTKTGFFEESPGVKSLTRLLVFMLIVYAIVVSGAMSIAGLMKYLQSNGNESLMGIAMAAGAFLTTVSTFAAGWKLIQKPMEGKSEGADQLTAGDVKDIMTRHLVQAAKDADTEIK